MDTVNVWTGEEAVIFGSYKRSHEHHDTPNATVTLDIRRNSSYVAVRITDDGQGFDARTLGAPNQPRRGLGILGMQERVKLVHGEFLLTSEEGSGTSIQVKIPLDPQLNTSDLD
jgi:signal transduction histidine kinase